MFKVQGATLVFLIFALLLFPFASHAQTCATLNGCLTWQDNSGNDPLVNNQEEGFRIERNLNGGAFAQLQVTVGADVQAFTDMTLQQSKTMDNVYCYRVQAFNSAGTSPYSNTACKTVAKMPLVVPPPAGGLKVSSISSSEVALSWNVNAPDADGQKVHVTATQGPGSGRQEWIAVDRLASNYTDRAVWRNTTYRYQVEAYNTAGGSFSNAVTTKTPR